MENDEKGNLKDRISKLLSKESSCDVQFLVGVPPQRFLCHRVILAAGSAVFETMFYGTLRQKSPVRVPDVEPLAFAIMLQYLYSDSVHLRDTREAFDVAYAAKKYILTNLFTICENYLLSRVSVVPENVFTFLEEASLLELNNLRRLCLRYISRNARNVFFSKSFLGASKNTFEEILRMDLMHVESERDIIEALWLWGEERCRQTGLDCSDINVRDFTRGLLKHVRFFDLTSGELAATLSKFHLLDTSDELSLLWNLAMPKGRKPWKMSPNICCESRTRCIRNSPRIRFPGQYKYDGNMTAFVTTTHVLEAEVTVTGPPIMLIGIVVACKPIPHYSLPDRLLHVEFLANNASSKASSGVKSTFEAVDEEEVQRLLLFEDYVVVEERQVASLTIKVSGEGVRLMHLSEETFHYNLGQSSVAFKFCGPKERLQEQSRWPFPVKELVVL